MAIEMNGLYIPGGDTPPGYSLALLGSAESRNGGLVASAFFGAYSMHSSLSRAARKFTGSEPLTGGDVGILSDVHARAVYWCEGSLVEVEGEINSAFGPITDVEKNKTVNKIIGLAHCLVLGGYCLGESIPTATDATITTWDRPVDLDLPYDIQWPQALTGKKWKTTSHNVRDLGGTADLLGQRSFDNKYYS